MKKLLFTTSTLPRFAGDPEPRFVLDLASALTDRYQVTILAPADPLSKLRESKGHLTVIRYRYAPLRCMERLAYPGAIMPRLRTNPWLWLTVPLLFLGLFRALRRLPVREFDLVHCHWIIPQGFVQAFGFRGPGARPFIVTSHGGDLTSFRGPIMRRLFEHVTSRAALTTLVSAKLRKEAGALLTNAPVIPMGVDTERFGPWQAAPGYFAGVTGEAPVLLFVGRLVEKKGVGVLLQAMLNADVRLTGAHLILVGAGPLKEQLEARSRALGLNEIVHFLPPVGHEELPVIYASADVLCAPSVIAANGDTDGLPTVLLEASASGTPCIGTTVGGIPEFLQDRYNGLLVAPKDVDALAGAIRCLVTDHELRVRLGRMASESASAYCWSKIADRFDAAYQPVLVLGTHKQGGGRP